MQQYYGGTEILLTVFHDNLEKIIAHLTKRIKQTKILNIPFLQE